MDSKDIINTEKEIEKLNLIKSKNKFINLKSDFFIQKLFGIMQTKISLKIIKCNIKLILIITKISLKNFHQLN